LGRPGGLAGDEKGATLSNQFSAAMLKFPFLGVPNAQASGEQPREAFLDPAVAQ
jgi:hypothetical protein